MNHFPLHSLYIFPSNKRCAQKSPKYIVSQQVSKSLAVASSRGGISFSTTERPKKESCYQLMNLLPVEMSAGRTSGSVSSERVSLSLSSLVGPDNRSVRRISKRGKIKNDPSGAVAEEEKAIEAKQRQKERKEELSLSLSLWPPACLARRPSDCLSSLFILAAFYPAGMINGFTEASLSSTPLCPETSTSNSTRSFSAFLRAGLPRPCPLRSSNTIQPLLVVRSRTPEINSAINMPI